MRENDGNEGNEGDEGDEGNEGGQAARAAQGSGANKRQRSADLAASTEPFQPTFFQSYDEYTVEQDPDAIEVHYEAEYAFQADHDMGEAEEEEEDEEETPSDGSPAPAPALAPAPAPTPAPVLVRAVADGPEGASFANASAMGSTTQTVASVNNTTPTFTPVSRQEFEEERDEEEKEE